MKTNEHIINELKSKHETVWINPNLEHVEPMGNIGGQSFLKVKAAQNRLLRFMPFLAEAFPETKEKKGLIESELIKIGENVFLKDDAHLPIAGSVKARGGIHEVLAYAEKLLQKERLLFPGDDYSEIFSDEYRDFFGKYTIQVGSTGNLGLSIGIISAKLGFKVIVHMSRDAKEWKKDLLRQKGVIVKEYESDYSTAVAEGRKISEADPDSYFIDDENSEDLFFGYATAALRTKVQLYKAQVIVDENHPLFVYLPCGVGGAPGGIAYGLKQMYGDNVHCFFAEPTGAPCFMLAMLDDRIPPISQIGLDGKTEADGLAVGQASGFVCKTVKNIVSGSYTVNDEKLKVYMKSFYKKTNIFLEPSACAGFYGPDYLINTEMFEEYKKNNNLQNSFSNATHIVWATGGGLVPVEVMNEYLFG